MNSKIILLFVTLACTTMLYSQEITTEIQQAQEITEHIENRSEETEDAQTSIPRKGRKRRRRSCNQEINQADTTIPSHYI